MIAQHLERKLNVPVERRFYLGGSYIAHQALIGGRIDIYPEYTGTALTAILKLPIGDSNATTVRTSVAREYSRRFQVRVSPPLGFNNTFAMIVRGDDARRMGIKSLSQAATFAPQWRAGVGYEFLERPDGFKGLAATYGLHFRETPRVMDLGLLYRALKDKQVDIVAGNSTDGLIAALDCVVLDDDKHYFPPYEAVPLVRQDSLARFPGLESALAELTNKISDDEMRRLNYAIDGEHRDVKLVVSEFLKSRGL
jgi:osmoprotectant transport system substrate-binding protein